MYILTYIHRIQISKCFWPVLEQYWGTSMQYWSGWDNQSSSTVHQKSIVFTASRTIVH